MNFKINPATSANRIIAIRFMLFYLLCHRASEAQGYDGARGTIKAMARPEVQEKLRLLGSEPAPMGSVEFGRFIEAEVSRWRPIVESSGAVVE